MMMGSEVRNRAEAIFKKKTVALRESERAMEDYKADQRALQEKTARLTFDPPKTKAFRNVQGAIRFPISANRLDGPLTELGRGYSSASENSLPRPGRLA